ncbi:GNAT family N-acetyltransferase [Bacillus timonensis]|nr:GNAT family N-acetyltransferase [Bacillus timonensis]
MFTFKVDQSIELKLLEKRDSKEVFEVLEENRLHLREWLPWVDGMTSEEDYEPILKMWLEQFAGNNGFQAGILYEGKFVGMVGFHGIDWNNSKTSIGYWLSKEGEGKGIMTKSVKAIVNHAFTYWNLHRVEIGCGEKNDKSRAIPKRLGFQIEGIRRDAECLYGKHHNIVMYSMLKSEWKM